MRLVLFVFTIIHGSGRPAGLPLPCIIVNAGLPTVYYCERKRKVKTGEAGNEAKAYASLNF